MIPLHFDPIRCPFSRLACPSAAASRVSMHLNECFATALALATAPVAGRGAGDELASSEAATAATNHASTEDLRECFSGWLLKTTTNFYESDDLVLSSWWFGALCWSFTVGGLVMLATKPRWTEDSRFPYLTFAFLLIFVQGPLAFTADYMNMTNDSLWHAVDRFMATPLMAFEVLKIVAMYPHVRTGTYVAYVLACCAAVASFLNSQMAQSAHDADSFVIWHNMWHAYPLVGSVIMMFDLYVLGEYDAAAEAGKKAATTHCSDSPHPKLLSTVVMEHTAVPPASPARGAEKLRARR
mmetsp:Transcript_699/g.1010  ORF Transcript_699/g.1010 Transcript_699/m.1010 type:complete len:297 (-) Transcript_699:710-1600(-)